MIHCFGLACIICIITIFSIPEISHGRGSLQMNKSVAARTDTTHGCEIHFSTIQLKIHQIQLRRQYFILIFQVHQYGIQFRVYGKKCGERR